MHSFVQPSQTKRVALTCRPLAAPRSGEGSIQDRVLTPSWFVLADFDATADEPAARRRMRSTEGSDGRQMRLGTMLPHSDLHRQRACHHLTLSRGGRSLTADVHIYMYRTSQYIYGVVVHPWWYVDPLVGGGALRPRSQYLGPWMYVARSSRRWADVLEKLTFVPERVVGYRSRLPCPPRQRARPGQSPEERRAPGDWSQGFVRKPTAL